MADTMTAAEIESAIDAIETQGRYIALHGLPGACPSEQDCRAFESFMRSGYAAKEKLRRMATAIKQREQTEDIFKWVLSSLVAAVSLLRRGGKQAAPSDKMFTIMLADYEKAIEAGRAVITAAMAKESGNG